MKDKEFYQFNKAIDIIKKNANKKFKETIEVSIHINTIPKKNITVKGYVLLPHNIEKIYKIAIFTTNKEQILDNIDNNILIINQDQLENLNKNNIKFDLLITDHKSILKIGKKSKLLNAKKKMPDIKYGTITDNIKNKLCELKKNYIKFKNDKNNIVNTQIGKIDLETNKLKENLETLIENIKKQKPINCKNISIKKISVSSTMNIGLNINLNSLMI